MHWHEGQAQLTRPANPAASEVADAHEGADQAPSADLRAAKTLYGKDLLWASRQAELMEQGVGRAGNPALHDHGIAQRLTE